MQRFRLIPSADVGELGEGNFYLFDRQAREHNLISVPTQKISATLAGVAKKLKARFPEGATREVIEAAFEDESDKRALGRLFDAGYLEKAPEPAPAEGAGEGGAAGSGEPEDPLEFFRTVSLKQYFLEPSFFGLPAKLPLDAVQVALVGVPVSTMTVSTGTTAMPDYLRRLTTRGASWFDVHAHGIFSEAGVRGPSVRCKGVVAKDLGDLGLECRTVGQLFDEASDFVEHVVMGTGVRPLFVGGDHAITWPIVTAMLDHHPDLALLHFDAHNDLFYAENLSFTHASPIRGLLQGTSLSTVWSFGMRTLFDPRPMGFTNLRPQDLEGRREGFSLPETRRLLADRAGFVERLRTLEGRPVYLSIDLDVLSPRAMEDQLSTPQGPGLEWDELLEAVDLIGEHTELVGADMVELSPHFGAATHTANLGLLALMLLLIDHLAGAR